MSLGNTIFMALLLVSYVAEITETIESYVEQAAYGLADVAHKRRFESQIRFSHLQWFCEGMRIFTYYDMSRFRWTKRHLTWALTNDPVVMTRQEVISAMENACARWAAVSPFTFKQVSPSEKPDIRVTAVSQTDFTFSTEVYHNISQHEMDREGVTIRYKRIPHWSDRSSKDWINFRFFMLYCMGLALGLDVSDVQGAVMYRVKSKIPHPGAKSPYDYKLAPDDIAKIQAKYGPPPSTRWTTGPYGGRPPTGNHGDRPPTGTSGGKQPAPTSSSTSESSSISETSSDSSDSSSSSSSSTSSSS